jgi:CheY-like chemotaxis protein
MTAATATMPSLLFVSHDADLRAVASRVLQREGWSVTAVEHGGHAFLACVENPVFEVLVIENDLPEGPGAAVARRLRRYFPQMEVVRMCDRAADPAGLGSAVVRPFVADDLIDAIQTRRRATSL